MNKMDQREPMDRGNEAKETAGSRGKFRDPATTAQGFNRARVPLVALETLWFNTGTLCNLSCQTCYIESTPRNDRLVYLTLDDVRVYLDEIKRDNHPTGLIGFTGGEPFMNRGLPSMLEEVLSRGFRALVLTNAMKPMQTAKADLERLKDTYGARLTVRVSLDHYCPATHEAERGERTWAPAIEGLIWLAKNGFELHVAGRMLTSEPEAELRAGYARLFSELGIGLDARDPVRLMLFPELDGNRDVPEISENCWAILGRSPESVMCASSRMIVKRKGADHPVVVSCTLLPYDARFELGRSLREAAEPVPLNHPHCSAFCVLGGAACSRS